MKVDIDAEAWEAVQRVRQRDLRFFESRGVPKEAIMQLGRSQWPFGLQRVQEASQRLYEPSEDGPVHVIVPVVVASAYDAWGLEFEATEIIDLIAFRTDSPQQWFWRTGSAWVLGGDLLDGDLPVPVVATPMDWLRSAGKALCILDWSAPPQCWARLRHGPPLQFSDDALRLRVSNALVANVALPPMEILHAA